MIIKLKYGGQFDLNDLIAFIRQSGRDYIIQGQRTVSLKDHKKPNSLDYWLRQFSKNPNTKQAEEEIMLKILQTGQFETGKFLCPDSGIRCKGLRLLVSSSKNKCI